MSFVSMKYATLFFLCVFYSMFRKKKHVIFKKQEGFFIGGGGCIQIQTTGKDSEEKVFMQKQTKQNLHKHLQM